MRIPVDAQLPPSLAGQAYTLMMTWTTNEADGQTAGSLEPTPLPEPSPRRHDLDALRAFAMLLGIVLHVGPPLAQSPGSAETWYPAVMTWLVSNIHGFRMPLFFLLSGFFSAMLWQRRGLAGVIRQRFKRIFLPMMLALIAIILPIRFMGMMGGGGPGGGGPPQGTIWAAAQRGRLDELREYIQAGLPLDEADPRFGMPPLVWAAMAGHAPIAAALLDAGADIHVGDREGSTPLHRAALLGRAEAGKLLIERGADPERQDNEGRLPRDFVQVPPPMAVQFAMMHGVPVPPPAIMEGRRVLFPLLGGPPGMQPPGTRPGMQPQDGQPGMRPQGGRPGMQPPGPGAAGNFFNGWLFRGNIWLHLWFLWYLCWLTAGFAAFAWLAERMHWKPLPLWLMRAPACLLWIVPLTLIPQLFSPGGQFGPGASLGLIPVPQFLLYYATFFGFGAALYFCGDGPARIGVGWWAMIPIAMLVFYPMSAVFNIADALAEVLFAWLMTFGFIGLFRAVLDRERPWVRYMSDASYWLYLAHVPVVMILIGISQSWPVPAVVKFMVICPVITVGLLFIYDKLVRYTWLGALLNGPRTRTARRSIALPQPLRS